MRTSRPSRRASSTFCVRSVSISLPGRSRPARLRISMFTMRQSKSPSSSNASSGLDRAERNLAQEMAAPCRFGDAAPRFAGADEDGRYRVAENRACRKKSGDENGFCP